MNMRTIVVLLFLAVVLVGGWQFRDRLAELIRRDGAAEQVVTQEMADRAGARLDALSAGDSERVALSQPEVQSLLVYRYRQVLPAFVDSPRVELRGDRMRIRARVPVEHLPRISGLGEAAGFLPDTAELSVAGRFIPMGNGRVAFGVDEVTTARIPLPGRFVPGLLREIGRADEAGLPDDAIALTLPAGATGAYVRRDSLIILGRPANGSQ
jgi:hypothetical protein